MSFKKLGAYIVALPLLVATSSSQAQADNLLQGGVQTQNYLPGNSGAGLRRQDMPKGDPFNSNQANPPVVEQMIQPPADAFDIQGLNPPVPAAINNQPTNLKAAINQDQGADFNGLPSEGFPDFQPQQATNVPQPNRIQQATAQADQADPDSSPDLQLAWDQWHRRVAAAIYQRFNVMAQMAFKYSRPLGVYVTYVVTRDGQITDVQLQRKSPNIAFNTLIILVIKSLSGQKDLLQFPEGSRRTSVDKGGMFTQNYGVQGFKYTTGDRETVHPH